VDVDAEVQASACTATDAAACSECDSKCTLLGRVDGSSGIYAKEDGL